MNGKTFMSRKLLGAAVVGLSTAFAVPVAMVAPAHAQDYTSGILSGKVSVYEGGVLSGATVKITSVDQGFTRSATTDSNGEFRVPLLPVGEYAVTITSAGYQPIESDGLKVTTSSGSYNFTAYPEGAAVQETIKVVAPKFTTDEFTATTGGLTVDVEELLSRTPVSRDVTSVALLAPGTARGDSAFGNIASFSGASVAENVYYVNGMNITDFRNQTGSSTIPFEFISTVDVKTGGYQSEFGRSTGGVINTVTKSGSNEFHFGGNVYLEPDFLQSSLADTYTSNNSEDENDTYEVNLWASGPIIKDRAFFYVLYAPTRGEYYDSYFTGYERTEDYEGDFWAAKLDVNIADGHRLEFTAFDDSNKSEYTDNLDLAGGTDYDRTDPKSFFVERGGTTMIGRYTGVFTDWLTLSALYGNTQYDYVQASDLDTPYVVDYRSGVATRTGRWGTSSFQDESDERELIRVDADLYAEFFGKHHFRIGFDQETLTSNTNVRYSGNERFLLLSYLQKREYSVSGDYETTANAFYVQDSWEINDRLTLQLGLRDDVFEAKNVYGETYYKSDDQIGPRVGLTYDVLGNGNSKLTAFFGRYFLPVATNTNIRLAGNELYQYWGYGSYSTNQYGEPVYDDSDSNLLFTGYFSDGVPDDPRELVSQNLEPMYSDEYILGYEQVVGDWTLGVRGIYRELARTLEDVAVDAGVLKWCDDNGISGCSNVWTGFHHYVLINPGSDLVYATDDLPGYEGTFVDVTVPAADLGYPEASRKYKAIELTFERPFDGKWGVQGSYTYSTVRGNYEGAVKSDNGQDDASLTQDFDQPGFVDGAYGPLPNEREHQLKLFGSYQIAEGLVVGSNLTVSSPRKYGCIGVHPTDVFAQAYGAAAWYCNGELTPRGSQLESDWLTQLDVAVSYTVPIDALGEVTLRADIFNVFDQNAVTDLNEFGEFDDGTADPNYGAPLSYQTPRYIRLGASVRF